MLRWYGAATRLQVARDAAFERLVVDESALDLATSYTLAAERLADEPAYYWRVGTPFDWSGAWRFVTSTDVAGEPEAELPATVTIESAWPNPFRDAVTLRVGVPCAGEVAVRAYDVLGREVAVIAEGSRAAGWHTLRWQAEALASGLYFVEVRTAEGGRSVRSVTRVR